MKSDEWHRARQRRQRRGIHLSIHSLWQTFFYYLREHVRRLPPRRVLLLTNPPPRRLTNDRMI